MLLIPLEFSVSGLMVFKFEQGAVLTSPLGHGTLVKPIGSVSSSSLDSSKTECQPSDSVMDLFPTCFLWISQKMRRKNEYK